MATVDEVDRIIDAIKRDDADAFASLLYTYPQHRYSDSGRERWLSFAISDGRLKVVKTLVSLGADVNAPANPTDSVPQPEGPMMYAAADGHLETVRYLLDIGVPANCVFEGHLRSVPLSMAAGGGHLDVVRVLVERGAVVNPAGLRSTPLDSARRNGQREVYEYLRSVGAKTAVELAAGE